MFPEVSDGSEDRSPADDFDEESEEDFVLDCDMLPTTPALTSDNDSKATSDMSMPRQFPPLNLVSKSPQTVSVPPEGGKETWDAEMDEEDDDLKELDAWLNSGAVEIVYS